ncbi:helix-turn-helix transcriptional regulator [Streptomyces sp. NPDC048106]|uniref:helix-turn-helix domain-containing protein n=1 Tax=Streptomyces sp. NPDC048106 TaxID=3155750 RepID=UPI0034522934
MAAPTGPTVRRVQLGKDLERLREQAGFSSTAKAVKHMPGISDTQLYRVERGTSAFRRATDLEAVLKVYGVENQDDIDFLVGIHKDSLNRGWWSTYSRVMPSGMAMYIGLEDGAKAIKAWQPDVVFGLFQTEAYARAVFESSKLVEERTTDFVEKGIRLRMERQEILTRENPVEIRAILDEAALRRKTGSQKIMREQIERLLDLAAMDNVTIQILPLDTATYRANFDFTLMEFDGGIPNFVQMDTFDGASTISDKDTEVWLFTRRFDALRDGSLPVGQTPKILHQLSREI